MYQLDGPKVTGRLVLGVVSISVLESWAGEPER
jgi:hypothetical protein